MKKLLKLAQRNLLYLVLLGFVFITTSALVLNKPEKIEIVFEPKKVTTTPIPVLNQTETFPVLSAQGAIAVDLSSSVILYEKNADQPLLPASTTKVMTALVARDYYPLEMVLKVDLMTVTGQKMGLVPEEEITVADLLAGLLIYSANDAAEVLAANYPGGQDLFVAAMNIKAKQIHLDDTHFSNPTGLDGNGHVSTARDMVRLSEYALRDPVIARLVATKKKVITSVDGKKVHYLTNINELLGLVDGVRGVKTGWTENARENLVTYIDRDGHQVLIAVLGSQDRFGETKELINWIFSNYSWQEVAYSP